MDVPRHSVPAGLLEDACRFTGIACREIGNVHGVTEIGAEIGMVSPEPSGNWLEIG